MNLKIFCKSAPWSLRWLSVLLCLGSPILSWSVASKGGTAVMVRWLVFVGLTSRWIPWLITVLCCSWSPLFSLTVSVWLIPIYVAFSKAPSRPMFLNVLFLWKNINNTQFPQPTFVNLHKMWSDTLTDFCPWSCRHSKRDVVNINNVKNTEDYCVDDCVMLCYPVTQFFHNYGFLFIVRIVWWSYWESLI